MKDQILEILELSKSLQMLRNKDDQELEEENVIKFLNNIPTDELSILKEKFEGSNKINKIRLFVVNWLLTKKNITKVNIEKIKSEVAAEYDENILHSWKSYFSLFLPFIYQEKIDELLKTIGKDLISKLGLDGLVKLKIVDFDGPNNFGSDKAWIAIYNKNQPSQSSSLQLFIQFMGDNVDYGLYRHATNERITPKIDNIAEFEYSEMISYLGKSKQEILDDNIHTKCWKFSPGKNGIYWDFMEEKGLAAIGWGNHSFSGKSRLQLKELLPSSKNRSIGIVKLFNDVNIGDKIIAFKGRNSIVGHGEITEVGLYSEQEIVPQSDFHNYHRVKWTRIDKPVVVSNVAMDAIADISNRWHEISKNLESQIPNLQQHNHQELTMNKLPLNQILYGPPGTGKTYNTINIALEILGENVNEIKSRKQIKELFDAKVLAGEIVFTTFHQSMSYEDFIEGLKPIEPKVEGQPVSYKVVDGIWQAPSILDT